MESDAINPEHYKQGSIECIDAMEIVLTAEEYRGFLKGNAIKYLWREDSKGGIEDLRKAKWYLDRLIEHCDESPIDRKQGLVAAWTCDDGKAKQVYPEPKWTPKIGDWVKIHKPRNTQVSATCWFTEMDKYDGKVIQVNQIEDDGIIHNNWGFLFDWLEPAEAPQQPSKEQPQLPDGWRKLDIGETMRDGDKFFKHDEWVDCRFSVGDKIRKNSRLTIRRNRFEVGEKVVRITENDKVYKVIASSENGFAVLNGFASPVSVIDLAPFIEDAK